MMSRNMKQHYCPYPFTQITTTPTGKFKLCCSSSEAHGFITDCPDTMNYDTSSHRIMEFWNSPYMNWVREKHLQNIPIKECEACFSYEKCGNESYRERAIRELGIHEKKLELPKSLDLKLGNRCNASCLFCDPSSSSRILNEWKEIGWDKNTPFQSGLTGQVSQEIFDINYDWADQPEFWRELLEISPGISNLKFTGGEPLINQYMMKYLFELIERGFAQKIRLQVTTNGITVPDKFLNILSSFKEVEINFSVDGYGKQNEYIRYPTSWKSWTRNVQKVEKTVAENVNLYFQHSLSVYSVFGLTDLFDWIWPQKHFGFHFFKVFHPEFQQPELLSGTEKEKIVSRLEQQQKVFTSRVESERDISLLREIRGIINQISNQKDKSHLKPELKDFISRLDQHRKISMRDYMPEAAKSLGLF